MAISQYDRLDEDRKWMNDYGCIRIVEESDENERNRPLWNHPIDEVWRASGFRSRSSVFRILNKHGIKLNRGKHSGPIKKKSERAGVGNEFVND